jgi:hypothetical protein
MAPHDQHSVVIGFDGVETSTPVAAPGLLSLIAIFSFNLSIFARHTISCGLPQPRNIRHQLRCDWVVWAASFYEKEVPQPQDFFAFGF